MRALAIAILYFYPPLSLTPRSPTIVLSPSGKSYGFLTNSKAWAIFIALSNSSIE